nr:MAG TPA: hypothetical protein [Caudoviricetes sp.]
MHLCAFVLRLRAIYFAFACDLFSVFLQIALDVYGNTVYNMTIEINKQQ